MSKERKGLVVPVPASGRSRRLGAKAVLSLMVAGLCFGAFAAQYSVNLGSVSTDGVADVYVYGADNGKQVLKFVPDATGEAVTITVTGSPASPNIIDSVAVVPSNVTNPVTIIWQASLAKSASAPAVAALALVEVEALGAGGVFRVERGVISTPAGIAVKSAADVVIGANAGGANSITVKSDRGSGIVTAGSVEVKSPGTGVYAVTGVKGGTDKGGGADTAGIIAGTGGVTVNGSSAGKISIAGSSAAIITDGTVVSINQTASGEVTLTANGRNVINAGTGGAVSVKNATLVHNAGAAFDGAASVISSLGAGDVGLENVTSNGGTAATALKGSLVLGGSGNVTVKKGAYTTAATAIETTGDIDIAGARIAGSSALVTGYLVIGSDVTVTADADSAVLSTTTAGAGVDVGVISASGDVFVRSAGARAAVRVGTGSGAAITSGGDKVRVWGSAFVPAYVTAAAGPAIAAAGNAAILDAVVTSLNNTQDDIAVVEAGGDIYVSERFRIGETYVGAPAGVTSGNAVALRSSAADGEAHILGGTVRARGGSAVVANKVYIGKNSGYDAGNIGAEVYNNAVLVESGVTVVEASGADNEVEINNPFARIVQTANNSNAATAEFAAVRSLSVTVSDVDSIVTRGIATAIDAGSAGEGVLSISGGVIRSGSGAIGGTAVRTAAANATNDILGGIIETNAANTPGSALPPYGAVRTASNIVISGDAVVRVANAASNAPAVYAEGAVDNVAVTVGGGSYKPAITSANGSAISLSVATVAVAGGTVSNGSNGALPVIHAASIASPGAAVTVSGGTVTANSGASAISVNSAGANVVVTGGTINVKGAGSGIAATTGTVTVGGARINIEAAGTGILTDAVSARSGAVAVNNGTEINIAAGGTGIRTNGGAIDITAGTDPGDATAITAAAAGTAVDSRASRQSGSAKAGAVTITAPASNGKVTVSSAGGTAISAADSVAITGADGVNVTVGTVSGTAISAAVVEVNCAGARIAASGASGAANAAAVSSRKVILTKGLIEAGTQDDNDPDLAKYTAAGISVAAADTVAGVIVIDNGGVVRAFGGGIAINNGNRNDSIDVKASGVVEAGRGGKAIVTAGHISVAGAVSAKSRGTAIEATAAAANARNLYIVTGASVTADTNGVAVLAAAGVTVRMSGGVASVKNGGTAVNTAGRINMSGGELKAADSLGTAVNLNTAAAAIEITAASTAPRVTSRDRGIVSAAAVDTARVTIRPSGSGAAHSVALSGLIDANVSINGSHAVTAGVVVNAGGTGPGADSRAMTVAAGRTVTVVQGGAFSPGANDTVIINGTVNTAATTGGGQKFENAGFVLVGKTGNVAFQKGTGTAAVNSFKNSAATGTIVLTKDARLNGEPVSDHLAWADTLTNASHRGFAGSNVVIPPKFSADTALVHASADAAPYSNRTGGAPSPSIVRPVFADTVYKVTNMQVYVDGRYRPYIGTGNASVKYSVVGGDLPFGIQFGTAGDTAIAMDSVDNASAPALSGGRFRGLLTGAGDYSFTARVENEAGFDERVYAVKVYPRAPEAGVHFSGVVAGGADVKKLGGAGGNASVSAPYTGKRIAVGFAADSVAPSAYKAVYEGFGNPTVWYEGDVDQNTVYPPSIEAPKDAGSYRISLSFTASGRNFGGVDVANPITLGTLAITPSPLADVLGVDPVYTIDLPAGVAIEGVTVPIADVAAFNSAYDPSSINTPQQTVSGIFVEGSARIVDNKELVFDVTGESERNQSLTFVINVLGGQGGNIQSTGSDVTVRVLFLDEAGLVEQAPWAQIDYVREEISGNFLPGRGYSLSAGGVEVVVDDGRDAAIDGSWFGETVSVVALKTGPYRIDSDPFRLPVPARPEAPEVAAEKDTIDEGANTGVILGATGAMEYRKSGAASWTGVSGTGIGGLAAGVYEVRVKATSNSFAGDAATVAIYGKPVSAAQTGREIVRDEAAAVAPVKAFTGEFTAGPNPAARSAGRVTLFWQGSALSKGALSVFDASGNFVRRVNIDDRAVSNSGRREIGVWKLDDAGGRAAADGVYVIKGVLAAKDGSRVKVSYIVSVR